MTPVEQFFSTLYNRQNGVLELRTFGPDKGDSSADAEMQRKAAFKLRAFVAVENGQVDFHSVSQFLAGCEAHRLGAFFGVALRTRKGAQERNGGAAFCQTLSALFVDADFKHLGEEATRKRIAALHFQPTMTVGSGAGLHPYWVLESPFILQMSGQYDHAKQTLRRFARLVAEVVDEQVSEPARVLRIPGSFNFKYVPPRPVMLESHTGCGLAPLSIGSSILGASTPDANRVNDDVGTIDDFVVE